MKIAKPIVGALALISAAAANATSLKDFWETRPADAPRLMSSKTLGQLEMCLGIEMSEMSGVPHVLHGTGETLLTSIVGMYQSTPLGGYRLIDRGQKREIIVGALKAGGTTNKLLLIAQRCA